MIKEPPNAYTKAQFFIYFFSLIAFFCSTMNGYDGSLINNLLQNPWFKAKYHVENDGIWAGIVSSMYQIGGVTALPFVGPTIDGFGRRIGMLSGATLIIIGTIIQGVGNQQSQFMGGRFLLGFGVSLAAASGPMYVVEINHPAYRGRVGGKSFLSFLSPRPSSKSILCHSHPADIIFLSCLSRPSSSRFSAPIKQFASGGYHYFVLSLSSPIISSLSPLIILSILRSHQAIRIRQTSYTNNHLFPPR